MHDEPRPASCWSTTTRCAAPACRTCCASAAAWTCWPRCPATPNRWPALREHKPDLLVLDLRMPATDGLTLLRRIRAEGIDTPAMILTMSDSEADLSAALRAGVRGYLLKDMEPEDVIAAIGNAARGELTVAPAMTLKLAQLLQGRPAGP
jgi:DNA-binding NarL/FixJ family response regulator